jgi:ankyrin repeat protein
MHCLINCCPEIDVNQRDHKGDTPLIIATKSRNFKTVKKLIWGKVNIDLMDDNGDTPLHLAAMNGDARLVSFLAFIAQLTSRNNKGRKVLALAARLGYGVIFKILLDKGADIHTTDNNLLTIMYQACIAEETEFLKYILTTPLFTAPSFVPDNDRGESALHYA